MAVNLNNPLDDQSINHEEDALLRSLQANILTGHGREHVVIFFAAISAGGVGRARSFLHRYPVTSARDQLDDRNRFKKRGETGRVVRLLFLTISGLKSFGRDEAFHNFEAFSAGMQQRPEVLDNGTTVAWQHEFRKSIDVAFLLAYHDADELAHIAAVFESELEANGFDIRFIQSGDAYRNKAGDGVEHFGYVDGRSQPLMLQTSIDEELDGLKSIKFDPKAPLKQFILADPLDPGRGFGSFFVFRKLEQNVFQFKEREQELADKLKLTGADRERAGAMVVGRFEDGTPLVEHDHEVGGPVSNNFDYGIDPNGGRCPFQSHIRKSHPRGSSPGGLEFDKSRQMARRGITYGKRLQDPDTREFVDKPNDGVGLLFMSYQAEIEEQFEFIQKTWVNSESFPRKTVDARPPGGDPVIGESLKIPQVWYPRYGSTDNPASFDFMHFVTLKGGEYFFTPSISGINAL